jgi:hypothetical protein
MESAAELQALARVGRDPRQRVRLLAIADIRDGTLVEDAVRATVRGARPCTGGLRAIERAARRRLATARARVGGAGSALSSGPRSGHGSWPVRM